MERGQYPESVRNRRRNENFLRMWLRGALRSVRLEAAPHAETGHFGLQSYRNALILFAVKRAWFAKTINKNNDKSRLLIIGSQVRALVHPPSSLRKPPFPESTPNWALLRGFPATYFRDFGLCGRSRFFGTISAPCLCIQKFR